MRGEEGPKGWERRRPTSGATPATNTPSHVRLLGVAPPVAAAFPPPEPSVKTREYRGQPLAPLPLLQRSALQPPRRELHGLSRTPPALRPFLLRAEARAGAIGVAVLGRNTIARGGACPELRRENTRWALIWPDQEALMSSCPLDPSVDSSLQRPGGCDLAAFC